jgi:hypothetical protein
MSFEAVMILSGVIVLCWVGYDKWAVRLRERKFTKQCMIEFFARKGQGRNRDR